MVRSDLQSNKYDGSAERCMKRTRFLICLETSSMPVESLEIARDISSFADASGADSL